MKKLIVILGVSVLLHAPLTALAQAPAAGTRVKQLDFHLENVRSWARKNRVVGGSVLLGLGALSGVGAAVTEDDGASAALWVTAGILGVTGGLVLALPTDYELLPEEYQSMSGKSGAELEAKASRGENVLRSLHDRARSARILGAASSIVFGVALVAVDWDHTGNQGDALGEALEESTDDLFVYTGIVTAGIGVVQLLVKSEPEKEYDAYQDWLKRGEKADYSPYRLVMAPSRSGAMVGLSYAF